MVEKLALTIVLLLILTLQSNANILFNSTIFLPLVKAQSLPNIVIFLADDMGMGDISPYNSAIDYTPNIQALSEQSELYTRFYAYPSCAPTRFSIITGLHPVRDSEFITHENPRSLPLEITTLPEWLQIVGYRTGHIGKWHLGTSGAIEQGFDFTRSHFMHPLTGQLWSGVQNDLSGQNKLVRDYPNMVSNLTIGALHFIRETPIEQPLFLYMAYTLPHIPIYSGWEGITGEGLYADSVHEIDWSVGEVLAEIEKRGQTDSTMVIFLSDNGPYQPERFDPITGEVITPERFQTNDYWLLNYEDVLNPERYYGGISDNDFGLMFRESTYDAGGNRVETAAKGSGYEAGVRVAAMLSYPNMVTPRIDNNPHATMDIYATVEKLISGQITYAIDGVDIFNDSHQRHYFYLTATGNLASIIDGDWKYHYSTGELFNLAINTEEISANDLSASNPAKAEELRLDGLAQEADKRGVLP